jgi:hypothetical protein
MADHHCAERNAGAEYNVVAQGRTTVAAKLSIGSAGAIADGC